LDAISQPPIVPSRIRLPITRENARVTALDGFPAEAKDAAVDAPWTRTDPDKQRRDGNLCFRGTLD